MPATDPNAEWIGNVQPIGLVVAPTVLARHGLNPAEQTRADTEAVRALLSGDDEGPALADPWSFFTQILGWRAAQVAGAPGGPVLDLSVHIEEGDTDLAPHWAVTDPETGWQILVRIEAPGVEPEKRGALQGWEATPHQQLERLLRDTGVPTGLLLTDGELRLIQAPSGETSGWLKFPLRSLGEVGGRPMLGGLKLILSSFRLHNDAPERRLPALLKASRDAQTEVSTRLAAQVLGALHELLRGLHAADRTRVEALAASRPEHLYEGLLTVLLRLVFLLYAEDRDLIPSRTDGEARALYAQGYGVRTLYARLLDDGAHNPDTMDERRGAWSRLLALFRLVHRGDRAGWIRGRGGKLFDPDAFPFLQGQDTPDDPPAPATVSDGCILRILDLLLSLDGEKLSYRTLDVEQIGSVYETVMGFTVETRAGPALAIRAGKNDKTPVFVDVAALTAAKGAARAKFLKEQATRGTLSDKVGKALAAAGGDAAVVEALRPIIDERGSPGGQLAGAGTPLLQPTDERRRTGSHYTPRSLTGPIVKHALEPAFERLGPDATPEAVLDLKVCDPAMGSGAFLVEACRAIGERLAQAWARWPETRPTIPDDEDEHLHARRSVAQRCLYGVDKNPRAVDLARLSLWLATLARDHEFTFLDHALKCGDSLVGLSNAQIAVANWDEAKPGLPLFRALVRDRIAEAMEARSEIQNAPDDTMRAIQEARHRNLEARLAPVRLIGDAVIAAFFAEDKPKPREMRRAEVENWLTGPPRELWEKLEQSAVPLTTRKYPVLPLHWQIEFPEVFVRENPGFDAFIGNPPFLGGNNISGIFGSSYLAWLQERNPQVDGNSDVVCYFFRVSFHRLRKGGAAGLLATNTIRQGDTRRGSLSYIVKNGGLIYRAVKRYAWPGAAAVIVSVIHFLKEATRGTPKAFLDTRQVSEISAFLLPNSANDDPARLSENRFRCFRGVSVMGDGFILEAEEAVRLIQNDLRNAEIISPYMGGRELNASPKNKFERYVINFGSRFHDECKKWPELLSIVEQRVKPERDSRARNAIAVRQQRYWWRFRSDTPVLRAALSEKSRCIALAEVGNHLSFAFQSTHQTFANTLNVFAIDDDHSFAILQSRIHEVWARFLGSSMKDDLRYNLSDCFETFPFPDNFGSCPKLGADGRGYHDHRAALMVRNNEGMTKTYNRFHTQEKQSEDIVCLRALHAEMDRTVLRAYGWDDIAEHAEPIFLDELNEDDHTYQGRLFWPSDFRDRVLARLLALNATRAAGLVPIYEDSDGKIDEEVEA